MRLYTAEAMRQADRRAVEGGYPSLLLMEWAGRKVAEVALKLGGRRAVILAGPGNNGGDGLAAARSLLGRMPLRVYAAPSKTQDAQTMRRALLAHGVEIAPLEAATWEEEDLVIDALFGTGLKGPLEGVYAELVERLRASRARVLAVDLPSGLPYKPHPQALATVALAGLKGEHLFYPHRSACGQVYLADIGMPKEALEDPTLPLILTPEALRPLLPRRPGEAHKGSVGRVGVLGGYREAGLAYAGAPALAALGAYRMGAGLVHLVYPEGLPLSPPLEAVLHPVLTPYLPPFRVEALAVGMGGGPWGRAWGLVALEAGLPTVLDADALDWKAIEAFGAKGLPAVLTPHAGEAGRLLGLSPQEVAQDPLRAAQALAQRTGQTVVLKGAPTVVAQGERLAVNPTGNPALATGGTGDVLAGAIAALLAAGLPPFEAACLGVYLHGLAGDLLAGGRLEAGWDGAARARRLGLLAHEVAEALPRAREALEAGEAPWPALPV